MAAAYYYADDSGKQNGPVGEETIVELIRNGVVRGETLVWTAGMSDWARADSVAAFAARLVRPPAAPQAPAPARAAAPDSAPEGRLTGVLPVWGLFWRSVVLALGVVLVLPAPWAGVWFYKWFASHVVLPGDRPLRLQASVGDSWLLFVGLGLNEWIGPGVNLGTRAHWGSLIAVILGVLLAWALMRWFCGRLATDDGATKLAFKGGLLALIGWYLLLALSCVTVIGWAWVLKFFYRWLAAKAEGAPRFAFHATGLAILWRTIVFMFGSMLLITIPWLARWYVNWTISQFSVEPAANA
jgi:hypothetical protein